MRLAVLSDTHLPQPDRWLDDIYQCYLEPAEHVIHLGDMVAFSVYSYFLQHPSFHSVVGNMDQWTLREELPEKRIVQFDGLTVGMIHGFGGDPESLENWVCNSFGPEPDLLCFGHTHIFQWRERQGGWLLNPGSARLPRRGSPSLAIVEKCPDGSLRCERVDLSGH